VVNRRNTWVMVAVLGLMSVAVGCAAPEPSISEACGTEVDPELIHPLLAPGEKATSDERGYAPEHSSCAISVDGRPSLYVYADIRTPTKDRFDNPDTKRLLQPAHPKTVDIGDDARIADDGALVVQDCVYQGKDLQFELSVLTAYKRKDLAEWREALEDFTRSYFPSALEESGCVTD
jgi:hypothetical protein